MGQPHNDCPARKHSTKGAKCYGELIESLPGMTSALALDAGQQWHGKRVRLKDFGPRQTV